MHLIHRSQSFILIALLFLCLTGVDYTSASRISGLPPVRGESPIRIPTSPNPQLSASTPASTSTPRSFFRYLFDRFSSILSSHASAGDSLTRWVDDRPRLIESLKGYEDQVVIRFNVSSAQHEAALRTVVDRMLLDVWDFTDSHVDIRIPTRRVRFLTRALPPSLLENHSILIPDLARLAAATYPSRRSLTHTQQLYDRGITPTSHTLPKKFDVVDVYFQDYQPYSVMVAWMRLVESMFRGRGLVQMINIGKSYEGRDIPALRIGIRPDNKDMSGHRRETLLVTGGFHAREWIATSTVNYVAWSFIQSVDKDPIVRKILERFDLVFIPVLNPDGYEYTWEVDRLWRKSRQRTKMAYCPGIDLDHSFSYEWGSADRQNEPCSGSYGGDEPLQAVEAAQLADWARNETENGSRFVGYLDLHSYSQQVLVPYSFSCDVQPPNIENLKEVAMNLAKRMRLSNGEFYTVASACGGAVQDAVGPLVEARGGYQIKLRDTGSYGFLLPSDNIIPVGDEVFQAMKYLGDFLLGNNGHEWTQEIPSNDGEPIVEEEEEDELITELRRRRRRNIGGE
ncbi:hypothetical protein E0Z10_g4442 [Xylaria hypoxylon]|uniref:Inactive metallocarboxypeptidase ECM14 n=1 Tax=Xylaria hypoxylon TaxID=37992 RepID=A0A4Z0YYK9_9PEZI|nr:hypothetical protein E0Z10_g4442 [Xylaria hypoxylon]